MNLLSKQQEYVSEAYEKLLDMTYLLIQAQIRTGKTLMTIEIYNKLICEKIIDFTLLILPANILYKWKEELEKYLISKRKVKIIDKDYTFEKNNIYLISYDKFSRQKDKFINIKWDMIIIDEIHYINNRKAKRTQAVFKLNSVYKIGISATPVRNFLDEIWPILHFFDKKYFASYWSFVGLFFNKKQVEVGYKHYVWKITLGSGEKQNELNKLLNTFSLHLERKSFNDYKELVQKDILWFDLIKEQQECYDTFINDFELDYNGVFKSAFTQAPRLSLLMSLLEIAWYFDIYEPKQNSKIFNFLLEKCIENEQKIIITGISKKFLIYFSKELDKNNIDYSLITGSTNKKNRNEIIKKSFTKGSFILLAQYKTIATGINLYHFNIMYQIGTAWNETENSQLHGRLVQPVKTNDEYNHIKYIYQLGTNVEISKKVFKLVQNKESVVSFINKTKDLHFI